MFVTLKNLRPKSRETAWDRFRRFNAQKDEPLIDLSELDKVLEEIFEQRGFNRMFRILDGDDVQPERPSREDIARTVPHGYVNIPGMKESRPTVVVPKEDSRQPSSVFDPRDFRKIFGDVIGTPSFNAIFGLDENGNPDPKHDIPDDGSVIEDEVDDEEPVKDPYVFIANRLTFLIQTLQPIIFDTSIIETGIHAKVNYMSIAVNTDKTYPKVETVNDIAWVMRECNGSREIRNEINEFLEGTEYGDICIFPSTIKRNGQEIPAVRFVLYPKRSQHNFGPAFLNHSK